MVDKKLEDFIKNFKEQYNIQGYYEFKKTIV